MPTPDVPHGGPRYIWEGREVEQPLALSVMSTLGKHISSVTPLCVLVLPRRRL